VAVVDDETRTLFKEETTERVPAGSRTSALLGDRFMLVRLLGRGGMGAVYRARDTLLDEDVALKIVDGPIDPRQFDAFRREVKLARRVTHPNVVRTFDMGMHERTPFVTMELLEGESLSSRLKREGPLAPGQIHAIATAIASGVASAHAASVLHLDLKPANVLIGKDGRIAVSDFGIASLAGSLTISAYAGTPAYMAPERLLGAVVDARADVYSIGVVMYEAMTGMRPPRDEKLKIERPDVLQELKFVVMRCLSPSPDLRYPSAAEVLDELRKYAPTKSNSMPPPREITGPVSGSHGIVVEPTRRTGRRIEDPIALERFLLGRVATSKVGFEPAREAVAHFDAALARCPESAILLASAALARIRMQMSVGEDMVERALELALHATEIDPDLPEARLSLAVVEVVRGNERVAMEPLVSSVAKAPWFADARAHLGEVLVQIGIVERGIEELMTAAAMEPIMEWPSFMAAQTYALLGDFEKCDAIFGHRPASDDNINGYGWRRVRTLLYSPTRERVASVRDDLAPYDFQLKFVVEAGIKMIETREVPEVLEATFGPMVTSSSAPKRTWFWNTVLVDVLAFTGRHEDALGHLERADEHGLVDVTWLEKTPLLAAVRGTPRYAAVHENVRARVAPILEAASRAGIAVA